MPPDDSIFPQDFQLFGTGTGRRPPHNQQQPHHPIIINPAPLQRAIRRDNQPILRSLLSATAYLLVSTPLLLFLNNTNNSDDFAQSSRAQYNFNLLLTGVNIFMDLAHLYSNTVYNNTIEALIPFHHDMLTRLINPDNQPNNARYTLFGEGHYAAVYIPDQHTVTLYSAQDPQLNAVIHDNNAINIDDPEQQNQQRPQI